MDFPEPLPYGPVYGIQQKRNLLPMVPCNQEYYKIFLRGHPKVFGVIQITLVSMHLSLGAVLTSSSYINFTTTANSGIPYWASVFYLVWGGLCVTVESRPSLALVKWTFVFTAITFLASVIEFCLICLDLNRLNSYDCPIWNHCWTTAYQVELHGIALAFLFLVCLQQLGMSTYLLFIGKRALKANKDCIPQVYDINNEYKYCMSSKMQQPANENSNYIPFTFDNKMSSIEIPDNFRKEDQLPAENYTGKINS
ncbi:membrane-spanning 4-domains subfamily A member 8-like [Pyxicephalus adspersus]|uniref:membrane-spanning 4-domains subfamily A member 8-like n=1 Tax=Pyxicephalus adspersus TaxID=30357 RepID=UPI003B5BD6CF